LDAIPDADADLDRTLVGLTEVNSGAMIDRISLTADPAATEGAGIVYGQIG
jgi:hypothetical protein